MLIASVYKVESSESRNDRHEVSKNLGDLTAHEGSGDNCHNAQQ